MLKKYFGYTSFREGQEPIVDAILAGKDVLGIMPTGAGKSICYQLPALMLEGITLIISPLISLMMDQVNALVQMGIPAAYLNSSLTMKQYQTALQKATNQEYKMIYISPERLMTDDFLQFSKNANIAMVTVDEAHCVSQWGQDFRPSYLKINQFIDQLKKRPVVSAFTATATSRVRDDISDKLELKNPFILTTGFDRKNLYFAVEKPKDKLGALKKILLLKKNQYGIVYCSTRKTVEEVYDDLKQEGYNIARYHAGLGDRERKASQNDFIFDRCNIIIATNAFGMGIDKSNVSYVIHYNMPKNMESYYQEAGRAGRDGEPAECILLYSGQDVVTNQYLIDIASENEDIDADTLRLVKARNHELLKVITYYCHTKDCLRKYFLSYFGENTRKPCGHCSNCLTNFEEIDVTIDAQKILSCVKRTGERYGVRMIIDVLRGSKNQKVQDHRLDQISTYGIMKGDSETKIREIINHLILGHYMESVGDQYPVVKLGIQSAKVLFEGQQISMKLQKQFEEEIIEDYANEAETSREKTSKTSTKAVRGKKTKSKAVRGKVQSHIDEQLFERLRQLRAKIASNQRVPAYIVFTDASLRDMCMKMPDSAASFLNVSGVGQAKLEKYGDDFLAEIEAYQSS